MNRVKCSYCGSFEEPVARGTSYFCACCSAQFEVEEILDANAMLDEDEIDDIDDVDDGDSFGESDTKNYISATCPVCQNDKDNTLDGHKCRCSLCGTKFDIPTYNNYSNNAYNSSYGNNYSYDFERIAKLENERDNHLKWGIILLILFWPVGLYKLYQWYQVNQKIKSMK